ncbi:MAG: hypothetical protein ACRDGQ_03630 [Candidatus Limnocylindrales bacterium]
MRWEVPGTDPKMKGGVPAESWLEIAVVVFGTALLAAGGVLVIGRLLGDLDGRDGRRQTAPWAGSIDPARHRNVGAVASR